MEGIDLNALEAKVGNLLQKKKRSVPVEEISKELGVPQAYVLTVLHTMGAVLENGGWTLPTL
jgi:hypothetical protein